MPRRGADIKPGSFQICSPSNLNAAPLIGSVGIFEAAGMDAVRGKSLRMTRFLMEMADALLSALSYGFSIGTPREDARFSAGRKAVS